MANVEMRRARFIGAETKLGREIRVKPEYARYRAWLGVEVEVELQTAEFLVSSATDTRVEITLPWGETEMVRSAHITGLVVADMETMYRTALDKRFPTTSRVPTATTKEEVAPPA